MYNSEKDEKPLSFLIYATAIIYKHDVSILLKLLWKSNTFFRKI